MNDHLLWTQTAESTQEIKEGVFLFFFPFIIFQLSSPDLHVYTAKQPQIRLN